MHVLRHDDVADDRELITATDFFEAAKKLISAVCRAKQWQTAITIKWRSPEP
jgi:hypothetical protein